MIYKVTFGFRGGSQGWTETHSMINASPNPLDLGPTLSDIAQKRANFLGAPFQIVGIRIARFYDDIGNVRARGSHLYKTVYTAANPTLTGGAEPADVALIGRGTPNVGGNPALAAFSGNQDTTFLGGPPDAAVNQGGIVDPGQAGLGGNYGSWRSAMIAASMGWLAVQRADLVPILAAVKLTDGTVQYTLTRDAVPDPTGQRMEVRVSGINGGNSLLNGAQIVRFTAPDIAVTVFGRAFNSPIIGGQMRIYLPVPIHLSYLDIELSLLTGQHDRGRPFGVPRGRQRRVPRV